MHHGPHQEQARQQLEQNTSAYVHRAKVSNDFTDGDMNWLISYNICYNEVPQGVHAGAMPEARHPARHPRHSAVVCPPERTSGGAGLPVPTDDPHCKRAMLITPSPLIKPPNSPLTTGCPAPPPIPPSPPPPNPAPA